MDEEELDPSAEEEGAEPADVDPVASVKRFVTIFLFILALFVLFDQQLRDAMGNAAGAVLAPLFAFDHQFPVFTFFPVAIVMVLATSLLRHVMMDWKEMARVQHVTSHLNKELFKATKNENKYKIKKLNSIKESPEFTELQKKQMGSTWKVMGPTMIIAVAIFAWMFSFAAAPVAFNVAEPDGAPYLVWDSNVLAAGTAGPDEEIQVSQSADVHIFGSRATGVIVRGYDGARFKGVTTGPVPLDQGRHVQLPAGTYTVRTLAGESSLSAGGTKLVFPVFFHNTSTGVASGKIWPAGSAGAAQTMTLSEPRNVTLLLPADAGSDDNGGVTVRFDARDRSGPNATRTVELGGDQVWELPPSTSRVIAKQGHVPWATFDLNGNTLLPNWILLYMLFTIPFGYLFQKLLKALEYRGQVDEGLLEIPED